MIIHSVFVENYRPFRVLEEMRLGPLSTIVGKNDVGKSNILRALQLFFLQSAKIDESDVHDNTGPEDNVVIEVAFTSLPENIELEEGIETTLQEEMLLDNNGHLRIRKIYPRNNLTKYSITLITEDFEGDRYSGLAALKANKLNERCTSVGIEARISGRGITNKSKREALRIRAGEEGIRIMNRELSLTTKDDLWKNITFLLPEFELFESDTRLGVGETTFQSQFRPIVKTAAEQHDVIEARDIFTGSISTAIQSEIDKIFEQFQRHTDAFTGLRVEPGFSWEKAVTFKILGKDRQGIEKSLDSRGSGMRRLLMVAFFQYLAERGSDGDYNIVFALEEPENCLHPGLQRELITSFRQLADEGYQIIVTSHSPVFAGAPPLEDLALVVRDAGVARAIQTPDLNLSDVAEQLGVEPSDQITGYKACVFVEGPSDVEFFQTVALKLKEAGHLDADFDDKRIGFIICGGENLKHWINLRAMSNINRRFGVVVDSDRESPQHSVPQRKLNWMQKCEERGGVPFILKKREIENYLHSDAIVRSGRTLQPYDEFTNMKATFGENVFKVIRDMSSDEILEMDRYEENGIEHHELKDIIQTFLALPV